MYASFVRALDISTSIRLLTKHKQNETAEEKKGITTEIYTRIKHSLYPAPKNKYWQNQAE